MIAKLHSLLSTFLLLLLVLLAGWWTLFLRGKLGDHEANLREAETEIAQLQGDLDETRNRAASLDAKLAGAQREIVQKSAAIVRLNKDVAERDARIDQLGVELAKSEAEVEALSVAVALLKVDQRMARIEVTRREQTSRGIRTHFIFTELDTQDEPLGKPMKLSVEGTRIYLEALVIKFDDSFVEAGDFLRGTSICLFKRVFGDRQRPDEGMVIEAAGSLPLAYGDSLPPNPFYRDLWEHFWAYADDPKAARAKGVRSLHGEAPFIESRPGRRYRILLRSSGGLSITPE